MTGGREWAYGVIMRQMIQQISIWISGVFLGRILDRIQQLEGKIIMKLQELEGKLVALADKSEKINAEVGGLKTAFNELKTQLENVDVPPGAEAALNRLETGLQKIDDINEDATAIPT